MLIFFFKAICISALYCCRKLSSQKSGWGDVSFLLRAVFWSVAIYRVVWVGFFFSGCSLRQWGNLHQSTSVDYLLSFYDSQQVRRNIFFFSSSCSCMLKLCWNNALGIVHTDKSVTVSWKMDTQSEKPTSRETPIYTPVPHPYPQTSLQKWWGRMGGR